MSETKQDPNTKPRPSAQEVINSMMPVLHKMLPQMVEVAALYHRNYPADTTHPSVIDAVTVAVPLRQYMISAAVLTHLCMIDKAREKNVTPTDTGIKAAPMNDPEVAG
jgi:hypothetical protein